MAEVNEQVPEQQSPPGPDVGALQQQLAASQAEQQRLAQEHQMALGYLQQMTAMIQQQQAAAAPPPAVADDDLFVQNPKAFKEQIMREAQAQAQQIVQQQVGPAAQAIAVERISAHRENALRDTSMPNFGKWEKEIYQVLAPAGVDHAINYQTWKHAYQIVASQHLDELVEERVARRQTSSEDEDYVAPVAEAPAREPGRIAAPGPVSSGGRGQTPLTQPNRRPPKLTAEERVYAQRSGMTAEEFAHYRENDSEDVMGFKGRDRI